MYTPSEVRWNRKGTPVKIVQSTDYPLDESVELRVEVPVPSEFTIFVRIPGWLESSPRITVNGKSFDGPARRRTFAAIRRKWKQNDTIQLRFPSTPRLMPVGSKHPNTVSVMYGPLALVAMNPPTDIFTKPLPVAHDFKLDQRRGGVFDLQTSGQKISFAPFYVVGDQTYSSYVLRA